MNATPFTQESDWARLLATLPEKTLLSMIEEKSKAQDMRWLNLMLRAGFFETTSSTAPAHSKNLLGKGPDPDSAWPERCKAMLSVMDTAAWSLKDDEDETNLNPKKAVFIVSPDAKDFFSGFCAHLASQVCGLSDAKQNDWVRSIIGQAMGLACMMDRPDALQTLIDACPQAAKAPFSETVIGHGMFTYKRQGKQSAMDLMPLFCALEFSSIACTEKLLVPLARLGNSLPVCTIHRDDSQPDNVNVLDSFFDLRLRGDPLAFTPLLKHLALREGVPPNGLISGALQEVMERNEKGQFPVNVRMLPAFLASGVANALQEQVLPLAIEHNHPTAIEHFRGQIDWDRMKNLATAADFGGENDLDDTPVAVAIDKLRAQSVLKLIELAQQDGRCDAVLAQIVSLHGKLCAHTARQLTATSVGVELMTALLQAGLDPLVAVAPDANSPKTGSRTLKDVATDAGSHAIDVIHSFMRREQARALIEQISGDTQPAHSPGP